MGFRFRKSVKIAPGIKLNFNKKSIGVTAGTRGAHYSVNSKGTRTTSVGIPGSGISYTKSTNKTNKSANTSKTSSNINADISSKEQSSKKSGGCLLTIGIISLIITFYSFAWIPGLVAIVYFALQKNKDRKYKLKRILISLGVVISSLFIAWLPSDTELDSLEVSLSHDTYDIHDTAELELKFTPSDASIDELTISKNDLVVLDYSEDGAKLSFKGKGTATVFFTANDSTESNSITITIVDKDAEVQKLKEEEKKKKAEEEAKKKAEEEAKKQTEKENNNKQETQQNIPTNQPETTDKPKDPVVEQPKTYSYILNTNTKKFHYPSCSSVKTIKPKNYATFEGTREEILNKGYESCGRCHP